MLTARTVALALALAGLAQGASVGKCSDDNEKCATWAAGGECSKNSGFMHSVCSLSCGTCPPPLDASLTKLGDERVTLHIAGYGTITIGFFHAAAPVTAKHIARLFELGCYDTNHFFRVDRGFVAQVQSVYQGATTKTLSPECRRLGAETVPGEFTAIPHTRGILSMGRHEDPNSGGSSFSFLLGDAPHLDRQYAVFGKVVDGDDVLAKMENTETVKEGIFVMPKERIEISRTDFRGKKSQREL